MGTAMSMLLARAMGCVPLENSGGLHSTHPSELFHLKAEEARVLTHQFPSVLDWWLLMVARFRM